MGAVQMRLLHHISRELIFKQVFALGIELRVQFNLSGAPLNFSSLTPVQYFGASIFTEVGGEDKRFFLISPRAGALGTHLVTKIPKETPPNRLQSKTLSLP